MNVLVVEDSQEDHELVLQALKRGGFDVNALRVASADALREAFLNPTWDAVISDYSMPGFDGMEALDLFKKSGRDVPFIVVSGREDIVRKMMKAGANDCIHKGSLSELAPTIQRELGEAEERRKRKLAEVKLAEAQQHLHQALDASALGAFSWDMVSDTTWRSRRYDEIVGDLQPEQIPDFDSFMRQVIPEDVERVRAEIASITNSGTFEIQCTINRRDGTPANVDLRGEIIHNENGRTSRIVGTIADITERNRLKDRVRDQNELIRLLLDSAAEALFGVDVQGNCFLANPACARILGYPCEASLIGKPIHNLICHHHADGTDYAIEDSPIFKTCQSGKNVRITDEYFWKADGTRFEVEYYSSPILRGQEVIGAVVTFMDVSDRRELETRLRQAQKMDAIGQLAGGVAHDFNNILAVILMQAGLVQTIPDLEPDVQEAVDGIASAAERAAKLTRQLLLFSRKEEMAMRTCELNEIVRNLTKMLERIISENISIVFKWSTEQLFINADPGMMEQILMNLVVNARDAMPAGGQIIVETSVKELDELMAAQMARGRPGSFVCLRVADTGCGIPAENLPRIFEPFFTTKAPDKGTGLGLSTVFGIVQQHAGWIHVETREGTGTTFFVFLPRVAPTQNGQTSAAPLTKQTRGHETILLVEDDPLVCESVHSLLENLGYQVLRAANGPEAYEQWNQHHDKIDLVLTDLIMPEGMSGEDLANRLIQEKPGVKIIFTSGYSQETAQTQINLQEGVNFLPKPYAPQRLCEILRRNLDAAPAA